MSLETTGLGQFTWGHSPERWWNQMWPNPTSVCLQNPCSFCYSSPRLPQPSGWLKRTGQSWEKVRCWPPTRVPYAHTPDCTNLLSMKPTHGSALRVADIIDLFLAGSLQNKVYDCRKVKPSHLIITIRGKRQSYRKNYNQKQQKQPRVYKQAPKSSAPPACDRAPCALGMDLFHTCDPWGPLGSQTICTICTLLFSPDSITER